MQVEIVAAPKKPNTATFTLPICDEHHTENGIIMIITRIKISEGQYFPLEQKDSGRFVAAVVPTIYSSYQYNALHIDNAEDLVIAGTKKQLLAKTKWK